MTRWLAGLLAALHGLACAAAPPACPPPEGGRLAGLDFKGRGDARCLDPVRISGAGKTGRGAGGIKRWLATCRPDARIVEQGLKREGGKTYEMVELRRAGGEVERICFDISAFFGTW
jgi:hypothetical protein